MESGSCSSSSFPMSTSRSKSVSERMLVRIDRGLLASSGDRDTGGVWMSVLVSIGRVVRATYQKGQPKMHLGRSSAVQVAFKMVNKLQHEIQLELVDSCCGILKVIGKGSPHALFTTAFLSKMDASDLVT